MAKIGIFFGTDSGNTRRVAKDIAALLGTEAAKPVNIRNASVSDLQAYEVLILGTPTYGEGALPGLDIGNATESWAEFLPKLAGQDFSGKKVAIYGLGNQKSYPQAFIDAVFYLYQHFQASGATLIGDWPTEGYQFSASKAVVNGRFVGLALDQENQRSLTAERLAAWLKNLSHSW